MESRTQRTNQKNQRQTSEKGEKTSHARGKIIIIKNLVIILKTRRVGSLTGYTFQH